MARARSVLARWLLAACLPLTAVSAQERPSTTADPPPQPEAASGMRAQKGWASRRFSVATANPLATQAAYDMLRAGGSAIDAAIAGQMVLTLVEPQSSGLGGGAFLLYHDGRDTEAYDGRETAPAAATEQLFLAPDGQPLPLPTVALGGRAVGTPGVLRMLELAHRRHGRLPWHRLFEPAIRLATEGFPLSPRLHTLLAQETQLRQDPVAATYFYDPAGQPWPVGYRLKNPELAAMLRRIAKRGADALHTGAIARAIVDKVRQYPSNPGGLTLTDLATYRAVLRLPLCFAYSAQPLTPAPAPASHYRLCGMPPPSSGAIAMGQILGLLAHTPAAALGPRHHQGAPLPGPDWLHLYAEAARLAVADRAAYVADPDFVAPPAGNWLSLLAPDYLARRAALIDTTPGAKRMPQAPAGSPPHGAVTSTRAVLPEQPEHGTSHISIMDARGHALAMTSSIEAAWGARLMVNRGRGLRGGFLLNNQLTDFSFVPRTAAGMPVANRVEPGKRPRSSMTPLLLFQQPSGRFVLSAGSPGGAYIFHYTSKLLYGVLHWGLDAQQAIDLPNFAIFDGPLLLEEGRFPSATLEALRARGHPVLEQALTSGLQAIEVRADGLYGGADPRREGLVMGD